LVGRFGGVGSAVGLPLAFVAAAVIAAAVGAEVDVGLGVADELSDAKGIGATATNRG
jgi:hypothetical protein